MIRRFATLLLTVTACSTLAAVATAAKPDVHGPRLTDSDLLQAIDLGFPGLDAVAKAVNVGNEPAALAALADFFRHRQEPDDFCPTPKNDMSAISGADKILRHSVNVCGITYDFPGAIDWYFNATTVPDSKYPRDNEWMWQLNRHREFETLGRAYRATGDEKYAREFAALLESWIRDCPVPEKGAWNAVNSPWRTIEAGIRTAYAWPAMLSAFRASPSISDRLLLDWLKSWIEHGRYLHRNPTRGNWLTMEMNGLYHVGTLVPFAREAESWRNFAADRLQKEMSVQVYPDGAQYELTTGYHNVALRNMLGIPRLAKTYGRELPAEYVAGLEKMFAYNMWVMVPNGDAPHWNDSSGADVPDILATGVELFPQRKDFLWIATGGKEGTPPDHTSHYFPWAGQVIMRSGWDRDALFLAIEVGPYGAAHQHEDKLSVIIFAGQPLLVEAGTYDYDASQWRRYVLSSRAHNLVLVDGGDQTRKKNPESKLAKGRLDAGFQTNEKFDFARGIYDEGFEGGANVRHTREVLFDKVNRLFLIRDQLESIDDREHLFEALWHLDAPKLTSDPPKGTYETQTESGHNLRLVAQTGDGLECRVVQGQEKPVVQGWLPGEPPLGVRPIPCVICARNGKKADFLTVFQPLNTHDERRVSEVAFNDGAVDVTWSDSQKTTIAWPK
jgi:hypothetical protein